MKQTFKHSLFAGFFLAIGLGCFWHFSSPSKADLQKRIAAWNQKDPAMIEKLNPIEMGRGKEMKGEVAKPPVAEPAIKPPHSRYQTERYRTHQPVAELTTNEDARGIYEVRKVYQVNAGPYHYIKVVETFRKDPQTHESKLIRRSEMLADRVLVRMQRGLSNKEFQAFLNRHSLQALRAFDSNQLQVLKFDAKNIDSLEKVVEHLKNDAVVESAEPNYLMRIQ